MLKKNWDSTIIWRKRECDDAKYPAFLDSKNVKKKNTVRFLCI